MRLLAQGHDRDTIAAAVGVTPGQVSAISAHVKMGTYALPEPDENSGRGAGRSPWPARKDEQLAPTCCKASKEPRGRETRLTPILLGR